MDMEGLILTKDVNIKSYDVEMSRELNAYRVFFMNRPDVEGQWRGTIEVYDSSSRYMRYRRIKEIYCDTREEMITQTTQELQRLETINYKPRRKR